jgi:hypothetical protein
MKSRLRGLPSPCSLHEKSDRSRHIIQAHQSSSSGLPAAKPHPDRYVNRSRYFPLWNKRLHHKQLADHCQFCSVAYSPRTPRQCDAFLARRKQTESKYCWTVRLSVRWTDFDWVWYKHHATGVVIFNFLQSVITTQQKNKNCEVGASLALTGTWNYAEQIFEKYETFVKGLVVYCKITWRQHEIYRWFLRSFPWMKMRGNC